MATSKRTLLLTLAALVGFAGNSLLCRMALGRRAIDAASFTTVRVGSGALVLVLLARLTGEGKSPVGSGSFAGGLALIAYAACFSFAYLRLVTGPGALILFGAVQVTMLLWAVRQGDRPRLREWLGLALALAGLTTLTVPGSTASDPIGVGLMGLAGIAWGVYTLLGKRATSPPLAATADNFLRALPVALVISILANGQRHISAQGLLLAVLSGALASGVGYTLWYAALPGLSRTRAAIVQLSVPVLAAIGGIVLLHERPTLRLIGGGSVIMAGLAMTLLGKAASSAPAQRA